MKELVLEGMRAGAIGFATSTSPAHNGDGGMPMPSRLADDAEMRALVGCLREAGRGVFMLTKGGQTTMPFLEELAAESGRPVVVAALLHSNTNPTRVFDDLDAIARRATARPPAGGAISCCPLTMDFTLHSPYLFEGLASLEAGDGAQGRGLPSECSPIRRFAKRCAQELASPAHFRLFNGEWDKVHVVETARAEHARSSTARSRTSPSGGQAIRSTCMLDLALAENLDTVFTRAAAQLGRGRGAAACCAIPSSLVSLSDAGAHLTFFNDAGFGLHLLGHWVRERGAAHAGRGGAR